MTETFIFLFIMKWIRVYRLRKLYVNGPEYVPAYSANVKFEGNYSACTISLDEFEDIMDEICMAEYAGKTPSNPFVRFIQNNAKIEYIERKLSPADMEDLMCLRDWYDF